MIPEPGIAGITHAIQLAIAPVFLLTAIGTIINALAGRLARAVDRRRAIEEAFEDRPEAIPALRLEELRILAQRIGYILWAMGLAVLSALLVCLLIGVAFGAAFVALDLTHTVGLLFIASVVALTGSLVLFMREVFLAAVSVRPAMWPHPARADRSQATAEKK